MAALKTRTADEAVGRWLGILPALGIEAKFLRNKHGACPICGGKDRFRFDDKNGKGTWFCSHCGPGDGFKLLQEYHGWDFSKAAKEVDGIVGQVVAMPVAAERDDDSKREALLKVWNGSRPVSKGDPVWLYLHNRLGLETVPQALRFHPALRYVGADGESLGTFPAMLARMQYPDGSGASIHRTYLTEAGMKANVPEAKKFMAAPKSLNTASVRLGAFGARLGIAEGIETALAASIRFQTPVWAATNAVLLEAWVPPAGAKEILIAGDNDASFTGQSAAYALAHRLVRDGYAVEIQIPGETGKDWADEGI